MNHAARIDSPPRDSLVDRAVDMVRDYIQANGLKVGDSLPGEGSFAAQLGVSRPVMREAFGALAALRLVDVGNGRRPRVGAIDGSVMAASMGHAVSTAQASLTDVWEVRRTLELRTAELAAIHRRDEQARAIMAAARALSDADDEASRTLHDTAFHQQIAAASGNPLFYQIVRSFEELMAVAIPRAWNVRETEAERHETVRWHLEVAEAINAKDPVRARAAMESHFNNAIGELLRAQSEE